MESHSPPASRPSRTALFVTGLLTLSIVVAFLDVLGPDRLLYNRDHIGLYRPYWEAVVESLRAGVLPSLTRADTSGAPLEAYPLGIYTPGTAIFFLARDLTWTWDLFVVFHYGVLAFGTFGLARALGADVLGAGLSAGIAAFSGPVLSLDNLTVLLLGFAYAPWVYWAFVRLLRNPSVGAAGWQALALGFHLQGPEPVLVVLDVAAFVALLAVVRPRVSARLVAALGGAAVLGLGIAALTLFPVLELLSVSRRGAGFTYAEASTRAWQLAQLPELLAPSFWTPPDKLFLNAPVVSGDPVGPFFYSLYLGTALSLVPVALLAPVRRGAKVALLIGLVAGALIALGPVTPLHRWIWTLPILKSGRYPVKYMLVVVAFAAALAPLALSGRRRAPLALVVAAGLQLLTCVVLLQVVHSPEFASFLGGALRPRPEFNHQGLRPELLPELAVSSMTSRLLHAAAFAFALLAIAASSAVPKGPRLGERLTEAALCAVVVLDLAFGARFTIFGASVESTRGPAPEVVERLAAGGQRVYPLLPGRRSAPIARNEDETYFEDAVRSSSRRGHHLHGAVRRYEEFDRNGLSNPIATLAFRFLSELRGEEALRLLARAGVAWIGSWIEIPDHPPAMRVEVPGERPELFTPVPNARPYLRAYAAWETVDLAAMSRDALRARFVDPERFEEAVVFAPEGGEGGLLAASSTTACAQAGAVELAQTSTVGHLEITYRGACANLVVVLETAMPGWTAAIDGQPVPVLQAELGFLAALVPPGEHQLRFDYVPKNRRWAPVTASCLFLALAAVVFGRFARARGARGSSPLRDSP